MQKSGWILDERQLTGRSAVAAEKKAFDYVRDVVRLADYNKIIFPFAVLSRFEYDKEMRAPL